VRQLVIKVFNITDARCNHEGMIILSQQRLVKARR